MALYLLDASVLITAHNSYYPIDRIPEFWDWLRHMGETNFIKIPIEIYEEIKDGPKNQSKDLLYSWIQEQVNREALVLEEEVVLDNVQYVTTNGYAPDLTDDELEKLGRDPFLVAYALTDPTNRWVVTVEASKPGRQRANRHLPDVCKSVNVLCCDPFEMNRALSFRTNWKVNEAS